MAEFKKLAGGFTYLEAPRWRDGKLWVSDFYTHKVVSIDLGGKVTEVAHVPQQPSGLGWLPDGTLLVVSMKDKKVLWQDKSGQLKVYADLSEIAGGYCNDMLVDPQGRAWVGNFGFDLMGGGDFQTATLARIDTDCSVHAAASGLYFPNGTVLSPDGTQLIVNESFGNRVSSFQINADGALGERQDWAVFGKPATGPDLGQYINGSVVAPDGSAIDSEGAVWISDCLGARVIRVAPGGEILQEISVAPQGTFACALGGEDKRTLFLCVAPDFDEHKRKAAREGEIWTTKVAVPGL